MNHCFLCGACKTDRLWAWAEEFYLAHIAKRGIPLAFDVCADCGLVRQNPFAPDDLVQRLYAELDFDVPVTDFDERYDWLCRTLGGEPEPGRLLDVGCSDGRQAAVYLSRSWQAVGVETSLSASEIAAQRGVEVFRCSVEEADLQHESFDLVLFFHLLEHLADPREFMARMVSCVKPNGYLYFELPNLQRPYGNLRNFFPAFHYYIFGPEHIARLLSEFELQIVRYEPAVNQRWLVRRVSSSAAPPRIDSTPWEVVQQAAYRQSLATSVAGAARTLCDAPLDEVQAYRIAQPLDPTARRYIQNVAQNLFAWHESLSRTAVERPGQAMLELILGLYGRLDIFHLLTQTCLRCIDSVFLFYWGRVVQTPDFYNDKLNRMFQEIAPAVYPQAMSSIETLLRALHVLLDDKSSPPE